MLMSILVWVLFLYAIFSSIKFAIADLELTWFKKAQFFVLYMTLIWFITVILTGVIGYVSTFVYNSLCIPVDWLGSVIVQHL